MHQLRFKIFLGILVWAPLALAKPALFSSDLPEEQRALALRPFFIPNPGDLLSLDPAELRDESHRKPDASLRGFIEVKPPKGICLTITRSEEQVDDVICKPKRLSFRLDELDAAGRLHWRVSTGAGDFGTPVSWASPYRPVTYLPIDRELTERSTWRWIERCEASVGGSTAKERKINIKLVGGERWLIRFPETDTLVIQPEKEANLVDNIIKNDGGPNLSAPKKDKPDPAESGWYITARGAYGMTSESLMTAGFSTPGSPGSCRYNYEGVRREPSTGILECHDTDRFKSVVIPLTCLHELKP